LIVVTDAMSALGDADVSAIELPGHQLADLEIRDGTARIKSTGVLAGSILSMDQVRRMSV
jgi:N-acetylglucosamine-6-phosphate deacetylase